MVNIYHLRNNANTNRNIRMKSANFSYQIFDKKFEVANKHINATNLLILCQLCRAGGTFSIRFRLKFSRQSICGTEESQNNKQSKKNYSAHENFGAFY